MAATALADHSRKLLVAQLLATRDTLLAQQTMALAAVSQIDTSLLALGVDVDQLGDPSPIPDACPHPADEIVNHHTTLDDEPDDWHCQACDARQPVPFHPSED